MDAQLVNPDEVRDLTGAARDNWFWDKLDKLRQANVNLVSEVELLKSMVDQRDELLQKARDDQQRHGAEVINMGKELNQAREAARTAVEDFIANTEE